jgi:hypothetical protein
MRKLNKTELTREQALQYPRSAYQYALEIDKHPRDDTRNASIIDPEYAFFYAKDVDQSPRTDTRQAASNNSYWKQQYKQFEGEYHEKTK